MGITIYPIPLGFDCCYLIQSDGIVMIDGGAPGKIKAFKKALTSLSIKPEDIRLIVITHGHWDHIGSARDIKDMTGAPIAVHEREKEWLEKALKPMPPGVNFWGHLLGKTIGLVLPLINIPAVQVDVTIDNEGFSLKNYGIPGKVIYTPGHSSGSVSVILETGDAFVGDMAMNQFPMSIRPGLPIFAEDLPTLKESWRRLLDEGVKTIYPAHGKPFSADILRGLMS
jgi:hydroxyacylglutathione hydrolase